MKVSELLLEIIKRISWKDIDDKPSTFPPDTHNHTVTDITEDESHKFVTDLEKESWNNKVDKSTTHKIVLTASNWVGEEAPYTYSINIPGMDEYKNWEVTNSVDPIMTVEELDAFCNARIIAGSQSTDTISLIAYKDKPETDINILVIVRGD